MADIPGVRAVDKPVYEAITHVMALQDAGDGNLQGPNPASFASLDLSTTLAKATGSTTPRTLADWLGDWNNVVAEGADDSGVANSAAAFVAAAANVSAHGTMFVPPGTYLLNTAPSAANIGLLALGASYTGAGFPPGTTDGTTWGRTPFIFQEHMSAAGTASAGSANQNVVHVGAVIADTSSLASYQKTAGYFRLLQYDPSNYTGDDILRDGTALEAQAAIPPGNLLGRIFGAHSFAHIYDLGDGLACGYQSELYNFGTDQAAVDTPTSKYVMDLVAGSGLATAMLKMGAGSGANFGFPADVGTAQFGVWAAPALFASGGEFLHLDGAFLVGKTGHVAIGTTAVDATAKLLFSNVTAGAVNQALFKNTSATGRSFLTFEWPGNNVFSLGLSNNTNEFKLCQAADITGAPIAIFDATGLNLMASQAIPAGGTAALGYRFSSTANFGMFFGSGAPTLAAAKGSIYLRSDGSGVADRAYINTNGSTTWTAFATAA